MPDDGVVREGGDGRFRALLADVGGTLVPDNLPERPGVREVRLRRLAAVLPELDEAAVAGLLDDMRADARAEADRLEQRTEELIAARLSARGTGLAERAGAVRRALSEPTGHEHPPFPGHQDLLRMAAELGLRRVLVTNTAWVDDDDWRRWLLASRGLMGLVDGLVTSVSAGHRKPHRAMFDIAVALAGCPAEACVFIGDRETKDVEPALAMGMMVIKVAIQEPPTGTAAHHQVTSLAAAVDTLRALQPLTKA